MEYNLVAGIIISQEHVAMFFSETMMSIYQTERGYIPQYPGMETVNSAYSRSLWLKKFKNFDSWCRLKCTSYRMVEVYRRFKGTSAVGVLSCQTTRYHIPEPTHGELRLYQTRPSLFCFFIFFSCCRLALDLMPFSILSSLLSRHLPLQQSSPVLPLKFNHWRCSWKADKKLRTFHSCLSGVNKAEW